MTNFRNRGVRKVDEGIISLGRSLVIDYEASEKGEVEWSDIPAGSLGVDKKTGKVYVKLLDTSWWTEIQVGAGGSQPPPVSDWDSGDFHPNGMTEIEILAEIFMLKNRIRDIELAVYGLNTPWDEKVDYSAQIRYARTKILDVSEGLIPGSPEPLKIYPASNAREALSSLNTICNVVVEAITGVNGSMLQVLTDQINELYSTIEPTARIMRPVTTPAELLDEIANIYDSIGDSLPSWLNDVSSMEDEQIYELVYQEVRIIQEMIYDRVQSARVQSLIIEETLNSETMSDSERIASLETQLQSIVSIIKNKE